MIEDDLARKSRSLLLLLHWPVNVLIDWLIHMIQMNDWYWLWLIVIEIYWNWLQYWLKLIEIDCTIVFFLHQIIPCSQSWLDYFENRWKTEWVDLRVPSPFRILRRERLATSPSSIRRHLWRFVGKRTILDCSSGLRDEQLLDLCTRGTRRPGSLAPILCLDMELWADVTSRYTMNNRGWHYWVEGRFNLAVYYVQQGLALLGWGPI